MFGVVIMLEYCPAAQFLKGGRDQALLQYVTVHIGIHGSLNAEHLHSTSFFVLPVLSGTCLVKPLYGLGHYAAAQFQGVAIFL